MRVMRDLVGEVLSDRYRIISRLAGGGMGEVYRGHDELLDRSVAVKVLQPSLASDPLLVERFRAEARAAARLTHPNVVAVYDWGAEDDRTYYMVMEYVAGTDLREILVSRGSLEPSQAVEIMSYVCDALAAAHAEGLVHRDIKPENILLSRSGDVKVADFGIAAVADAERTQPGGSVPGTLRYLSPEQARGDGVGPGTDIWAAGAVLAELVTGTSLPQARGADFLHRRATEAPKPPSDYKADLPLVLDDVVLKACALDPGDRFGDVASMAWELRGIRPLLPDGEDLDDLLREITGDIRLPDVALTAVERPGRTNKRRRRSRMKLAGAGLLVVVALILFALGALGGPAAPDLVEVPSLAGLTKAKAAAKLESRGLELAVEDRRSDFDVPRGAILSQDPADGEIKPGTTIEVVISTGLPFRKVPDLRNIPLRDAQVRLRAMGLTPADEVSETFAPQPAGEVVALTPLPGARVRWGTTVKIVISKGPQPITMPSVDGMKLSKAIAKLEDAGFEPTVVNDYSNSIDAGLVIRTDPSGGSVAPDGSEVTVYVSKGPRYKELTMPDVRGLTVDDAQRRLSAMGFTNVEVVQSCGGGGTMVSETEPIAGKTVRENERIALFVC